MPSSFSPKRRPITVSIVSHGQLALIAPLLEQLASFSATAIDKVVLTINIPEADPIGAPGEGLPIERIHNSAPKGFGANHNAAFSRCESDWFLVLNPDIRLDADILTPLMAQAAPDTGLLAPRIFESGRRTAEAHRALLTPREILTRNRPGYCAPARPDWVPGLFMLLRSAVYRQIGGFDERYFMYGEDADLCARVRLAHWQLQVAETLQARHDAQRASHRDFRYLYWHATSLMRWWASPVFWRYRQLCQNAQP